MSSYADLLGPRRGPPGQAHQGHTPQRQVLAGRADMVKNNAGGFVFKTDTWTTLRRFLILGTVHGTFYVRAEKMGADALRMLDTVLELDPIRTIDEIVSVSESGAALKQSPAIFALARACSRMIGDAKRDCDHKEPTTQGRAYALANAPRVLRTLSHVFEFTDYCRRLRGGGPGLRRAIGALFTQRSTADVEYQALKYRNRNGWTPRDALRYAHVRPTDPQKSNLFGWIVKPESDAGRQAVAESERLAAFEELNKTSVEVSRAVELITAQRFTHEFVPNTLLNDASVWRALLPNLPLTALIRNLRKLTQVGVLVDGSAEIELFRKRLVNAEALRKARVHPLRILMAERQYRSGTSRYGHGGDFTPSGEVLSVLEDALELSFSAVEPLNRDVLIAVDNSGSMTFASGAEGLTCFEAGLAMALWYKRTERRCRLVVFTQQNTTKLLNVSSKITWDALLNSVRQNPAGTDLADPIEWLMRDSKQEIPELIVEITDNETWGGRSHVVEALGRLRKKAKHPIAFVVAAVTSTEMTVADPNDPHSLNVVGFDATVPEVIAAHVKEVFGDK